MKKDIYVIKNRINNKCYVGQAKNSSERFISHCKLSSAKSGSMIDRAIQKYGANNFWFEVLESQVENYNERENFWIQKLNTIKPFGYNLTFGGEEPPVYCGIEHPLSTFDSVEEVKQLKDDLKNTQLSLSTIAKKYNVSKRTVMRINQGLHYEDVNDSYPIRKTPLMNGKLTDEDVKEIIEILKMTYRQYEDIGKQFGVSLSDVRKINSGEVHKQLNESYPIRKYKNSGKSNCTYAQVTEIIDLLTTTDVSCNQISKCYGVDLQTIYAIKNGSTKRYKRDGYKYPLRKNNHIK